MASTLSEKKRPEQVKGRPEQIKAAGQRIGPDQVVSSGRRERLPYIV
jgi:hypothetical protein